MTIESLKRGNALIILEGLDEIPIHLNRADLIQEINALLEKGVDYDANLNKLSCSMFENKEICGTEDPDVGNRFIITSRIEGNYYDDINTYIPRLTIEDMSNEALEAFCGSYMECIHDMTKKNALDHDKPFVREQLYNSIKANDEIFRLAINPQLASVIATVYNQYDNKLPNKRIDLYEKAIERMIERLINMFSVKISTTLFSLNRTIVWSLMQEIAEYLHNRSEGLTEEKLKEIVRTFLKNSANENAQIPYDDIMTTLVDIIKVHSGLLSEFGQNSFKFLHRTFQEYLAAKNLVYFKGVERSENSIFENISNKITNPNWRIPLSMAFGMLSKSMETNQLFDNILARLIKNEQSSTDDVKMSSTLTPFVIIDFINDLSFPFKDKEHQLVENLAELLLMDYKNLHGFSRFKEHQELIEHYFLKLKISYENIIAEWLKEKLNKFQECMAPCANLLLKLKWYTPFFHEIFLKNLHNDSNLYNWSIDSILRFYSKSGEKELLKLKPLL